MSMRASIPVFAAFQLAAAGALIGWCVVSVYEGRQLDQCSQDVSRQMQYNQARLNTIQMRQATLHARAAETAKTATQKKGG
jgi:hypothetical protein